MLREFLSKSDFFNPGGASAWATYTPFVFNADGEDTGAPVNGRHVNYPYPWRLPPAADLPAPPPARAGVFAWYFNRQTLDGEAMDPWVFYIGSAAGEGTPSGLARRHNELRFGAERERLAAYVGPVLAQLAAGIDWSGFTLDPKAPIRVDYLVTDRAMMAEQLLLANLVVPLTGSGPTVRRCFRLDAYYLCPQEVAEATHVGRNPVHTLISELGLADVNHDVEEALDHRFPSGVEAARKLHRVDSGNAESKSTGLDEVDELVEWGRRIANAVADAERDGVTARDEVIQALRGPFADEASAESALKEVGAQWLDRVGGPKRVEALATDRDKLLDAITDVWHA